LSDKDLNKQRCIQYLAKEYTEEECITFEIDLLFDEELQATYQLYRSLWRAYPTTSEILLEKKQPLSFFSSRFSNAFTFLFTTYGQVACTVAMLVLSFCAAYQLFTPVVAAPAHHYRIYTNIEGQRKTITLEDGSVVTLNGKGRLQVTQNDSTRLAWLDGEAFFDVVKNTRQKFIVKHEDLEVEVVGTQFSVNTLGAEKQVALLSGKVLAKMGNGEQLFLKPNEQLLWNTTLGEVKRIKADVAEQTAWRTNQLIFHDEPLSQALQRINHFYGITFTLQDPSLASKRITGVFDNQTAAEFAQALAFITHSTITLQHNTYLIQSHANYSLPEKQQ